MTESILLRGLDASNPMAFLAALGMLRALSCAWPTESLRLHWAQSDGALRPVLTHPKGIDQDAIVKSLVDELRNLTTSPAMTFSDDLAVPVQAFRKAARHAQDQASVHDRISADFIAGFGCDAIQDAKTGIVQDTAWRTMSGAGHQHFLGFMRTLASQTTEDQLRAALFAPWDYRDPGPSLRWDPIDDRRYALRWSEPSGDPIRTMRGANALAIQGLPLFATQPDSTTLATTGFSRIPRKGTFLSWPIWDSPLTLDVIRSLLALRELQEAQPNRQQIGALGIVEVFRSQRITQGKYRNFTPGTPA